MACSVRGLIRVPTAPRLLGATGGIAALLVLAACVRAAEPELPTSATTTQQRADYEADTPNRFSSCNHFASRTVPPCDARTE